MSAYTSFKEPLWYLLSTLVNNTYINVNSIRNVNKGAKISAPLSLF